ncbi:MAG: branched-chain amino acid ABC transporter permease/ATP-binding protein [Solirubrobacteraceae bacterium]|nr:branched-chain amino acid ABC transporter permease/ATP-binding protein [Patulibacter sp.]
MTEFIQYALLGLGAAAGYALLGGGVVLINRGAGVINFSHAAMAMLGGLIFYSLRDVHGLPAAPAFIVSTAAVALLGVLFFLLVMRPLGSGAPFARTVATLGLLIILQGLGTLIWGVTPISVGTFLPTKILHIGGVVVSADRLVIYAIAILLTVALWASSKYTKTGLALRALSENPRAAATLGWSPIRLGALTWGAGGALAAVAGMLIAPTAGVSPDSTPLLIIPVLAAVLLASFQSFPVLLVAATVIGVGQSLITNYWSLTGAAQSLPFVIIVVFLVIRGGGVTSRSNISERLPMLGTGRVSWKAVVVTVIAMVVFLNIISSENLMQAIVVTAAWSLIGLSIIVVMGFTGQLSLAQVALGGIAALTAAQLMSRSSVPFLLALVAAIAVSVVVGLVFAIPALRTRGINLAIVTLGLASVTSEMVFKNTSLTSSVGSIVIPSPSLFGTDIGPLLNIRRYTIFVFVVFILAALVVAAVRRGTAGGRLIAVRTNERAAAALGVSVRGAKLYAFGFAAAIAGLGGVLLAFANAAVDVSTFTPIQSVYAVAYGIVGGVGFVVGAPGGAQLAPGGIGSWLLNQISSSASALWLQVLSGTVLILLLLAQPDGLARDWVRQANWVRRRFTRKSKVKAPRVHELPLGIDDAQVAPATLTVEDLSVRFGGGVLAVDKVSLTVSPGEIVALIGPNGAGKSTTIDAITGFVGSTGAIRVNDESLSGLQAYKRSRLGLSRSFQSLELFESLTVLDNLLVGADDGNTRDYYRDLVRPKRPELGPLASLAVREFGLLDLLDLRVDELPYGQRRLVAVARALASEPSILLLDEPAAGLGDVETREFERVVRLLAAHGLAILLVEHDMRFVMDISDRIVVLETGRFLAAGSPDEIRRTPAVIEAYLGATTAPDGDVAAPSLSPIGGSAS